MESLASESNDEVMSGKFEWRYEYAAFGAVSNNGDRRDSAGCPVAIAVWLGRPIVGWGPGRLGLMEERGGWASH